MEVKDCQANFLLFDRVGFVGDQEPFAFAAAFAKVSSSGTSSKSNKPVRFTYVIYENQRSGWVLAGQAIYCPERTPWTDEF